MKVSVIRQATVKLVYRVYGTSQGEFDSVECFFLPSTLIVLSKILNRKFVTNSSETRKGKKLHRAHQVWSVDRVVQALWMMTYGQGKLCTS